MTISALQENGATAPGATTAKGAPEDGAAFGDALAALLVEPPVAGVGLMPDAAAPPGTAPPLLSVAPELPSTTQGSESGKMETPARSADSKDQDPLTTTSPEAQLLSAAFAVVAAPLPTPPVATEAAQIASVTNAPTKLNAKFSASSKAGVEGPEGTTSGFRSVLEEASGDASAAESALGPIQITGESAFQEPSGDGEKRDDSDATAAVETASSAVADRPAALRETGKADGPLAPLTQRQRLEVVHQVTRHIEKLEIASVRRPVEIRMEPAELGQVTVTLARESGGLVADFAASDTRVAQALDRHRSELAGALAHRGFETARITVAATEATSTPQFDFGSGGQGGSTPHDSPPRQNGAPYAPAPGDKAATRPTLRFGQSLDIAI